MNYTNTNNYSNSQLQKPDSFEDYYYKKDKTNLYDDYPPTNVSSRNNKNDSNNDTYRPTSYVNNNTPPTTTGNVRTNNSSNIERYSSASYPSTLLPVNSSYPPYHSDKAYPNGVSGRDQSMPLPPPPKDLDKNEFKNIYVKVKSERLSERCNNMVDYSVYDTGNLKYSREEIEQLKKELNIEFNGIDTLEEFKKLNQNEQKKLIIQICRFLMSKFFFFHPQKNELNF
ncbi:hypothetical protein PIROE2DRAFT_65316 [Piromyces sp. E2]|nr:hypothetical protein PIROE2DRAFT_65316 [Piromyces sp. E2]|eukprot:OUM56875.1 hypothetical protein PIROE2DRAFT_65316 [Piromyces sp. E2]